jgi:hypothetical protein
MKTGMLWFDNDPKSDLETKVDRAASYYQRKYGKKPDVCFVNPTMLAAKPQRAAGVEIRVTRTVAPYHLWIGVNEPAPSPKKEPMLAAV